MSVLMATSSMPSVAYAADLFSDGSAVEFAAEEADAFTEDAAAFAEEADTDDAALQASSGYQTVKDSVVFHYGAESEEADYTVTYKVERMGANGQPEYDWIETKATVVETIAATCTETPKIILKVVTIDEQTFVSDKMTTGKWVDGKFVLDKELGHDWVKGERYVTKYPTHTAPGEGYTKYTCSRCGKDKKESINDELQAYGHEWSDEVTYIAEENIKTDPTATTKILTAEGVVEVPKVVLDENGIPELEDPTMDGSYTTEVRCVNWGKKDANGEVDFGVTDHKEGNIVLAKKGVYAWVVSVEGIQRGVVVGQEYTGTIDEKTIELINCDKAGSYVVEYRNNNNQPISRKTFTVAPHHMEVVDIEFATKEDADQCTVTRNSDGSYTVTNNSCYLPITYYEVTHCAAWGCPNKKCDTTKYYCEHQEYKEVGRVEKVAQPEGKHIINNNLKTDLTDLIKAGATFTATDFETLAKEKDSYIRIAKDTSTCTEAGTVTIEYLCKLCEKAVETKDYEVKAKGHLDLPAISENVTLPTCTAEGHYDAVVYCGREECGAELSRRENVRIPRIKHTNEVSVDEYGNGVDDTVTDKTAQVEFVGDTVVDYNSSVLNAKTAAARAEAYAKVLADRVAADEDEFVVNSQAFTECDVCGYKVVLSPAKPVITVDNVVKQGKDCQPGSITLTSTFTKADGKKVVVTETFAYYTTMDAYHGRTAHDPAPAVKENVVEATATENGSYDEVVYCSVCGTEISRKNVIVNATGDIILPAVTGLKATATGMKRVALTWDAVEGAEGYFVIGFGENRTGSQIAYTTRTTWTDTAADSDAFNFYWVQPFCRNTSGKIVKGELGEYKYALGRVVAATSKVTAVATEDGIELNWASVSGANSYVVLSKTGSADAEFNASVATDTTTFVDTAAEAGEVTYYWVYATYKNADGKVLAAGKTSPFAWAIAK